MGIPWGVCHRTSKKTEEMLTLDSSQRLPSAEPAYVRVRGKGGKQIKASLIFVFLPPPVDA